MSTSRDLFYGYAGSSHQPQGRVLTAEEEYGALMSESLLAEEEYGFDDDDDFGALMSESLLAEEEYGEDEDDEFGALTSRSLFAEEAYGEDEDDEDDDFGGGYQWYGADEDDDDDDDDDEDDEEAGYIDAYGAEISADIDELDEELDEDLFGAWYGAAGGTLAVPEGAGPAIQMLGDAVNAPGVFLPDFLTTAGADPGWIEWGMEKLADFVAPGDADEIAAYLMNQPGFGQWNSMTPEQQAQMVHNAVFQAAIPGLEMNWDEPFRQAWNSNPSAIGAAWAGIKSTPSAVWAFITSDTPNMVVAWLREVPGLSPAIDGLMAQAGVERPDQVVNGLAIRYWAIGLVFPQVYNWIAAAVTKQGQGAIAAYNEATAPQDLGPMQPALPVIPAPPEVLAAPQTGLPSPQTILAVGYGVMTAGAVLGVFR